jgi:hypothetical protein
MPGSVRLSCLWSVGGLGQQVRVIGDLPARHHRAGLVEDANRQQPGVQVNAAVKSVRRVVEAHHGLLAYGWGC